MARCAQPLKDVSLALGGGGAFGIAFHLGIFRGLDSEGVNLRHEAMLGVSAGSWAASALAKDTPLDAISEVWKDPRLCAARPAPVLAATTKVWGQDRDARVTGAVIRLPSGRRTLLNGATHTLAEIVAAASSPPILADPYLLDGRRVYDAGVVHNTCADLAPPARNLIVVAPLSRRTLGRQGFIWEQRLLREVTAWRMKHRGSVLVMRPSVDVVNRAGRNWDDLFDGHLMQETYKLAFRQGVRFAARLRTRIGSAGQADARASA